MIAKRVFRHVWENPVSLVILSLLAGVLIAMAGDPRPIGQQLRVAFTPVTHSECERK